MQTTRHACKKCCVLLMPSSPRIIALKCQLSRSSRNYLHTAASLAENEKQHNSNKTPKTFKVSRSETPEKSVSELKTSLSEPDSENNKPGKAPPPAPPSNCCRTNCANCVWIQYALEVTDYYKDGGSEAMKFLDDVDDPALKAFLKMELQEKLQENEED